MTETNTPFVWRVLRRLVDIGALLALLGIIYTLYSQAHQDPADYMILDEISVSDHELNTDPPLLYDPTILQSFWVSWSRKIYPANLATVVCQGRGRSYLEPLDEVGELTLSDFMDVKCLLPPGAYLIRSSWVLDNGLIIKNTSNTFRVVKTEVELETLTDPPIIPAEPALPLGPLLLLPDIRQEGSDGAIQ